MMTEEKNYYIEKKFAEEHGGFVTDVLSSLPVCVKVFDDKLRLVFMNAWGLQEHGLTPASDFAAYDYFDSVADGDRESVRQAARDALSGKVRYGEFQHVPGRSRNEWCFSAAAPLRTNGGRARYAVLSSMDFTEYTKAEIAMQRERRMFKLLLDAAPLCIKWFDASGNLISVNRAGREEHRLSSLNEFELRKWDYWACIEPDYRDAVKQKMAAAQRGEETTPFFMRHVPGTANGDWCKSVIAPVKNDAGAVELILFISQDVTREKAAETAEAEQVGELERLNNIFIGRELKMAELKDEIETLRERVKTLEAAGKSGGGAGA